MLTIVNNNFLFTQFKRIDEFQKIIEQQLQTYFSVNNEKLKTSQYGLTGAGLQLKSSTIKILIRMEKIVETIKPLFEHVNKALD